MKRPILLLFAALLWGGTGLLHAQAEAPFLPSAADARCKQWVDSVYSGLNLQEKVGQLIVTTFPAKVDKQKKKQIRDLVKKYKIGVCCLPKVHGRAGYTDEYCPEEF